MNKLDILNYIKANPAWLSGLIDGEGSFGISVSERVSKVYQRVNYSVSSTFYLGLNGRDLYVLEGVQEFFGCGYITTAGLKSGFFYSYQIRANNDLMTKLIPFLDTHPLCTTKSKDYADFKTVVNMIARKEHLTSEGLATIRTIKAGMNRGRII